MEERGRREAGRGAGHLKTCGGTQLYIIALLFHRCFDDGSPRGILHFICRECSGAKKIIASAVHRTYRYVIVTREGGLEVFS